MFRFTRLHLLQYRCFAMLDLDLEPDLTVIFAENGGGKTAVLNALALGLTAFQSETPQGLGHDPEAQSGPGMTRVSAAQSCAWRPGRSSPGGSFPMVSMYTLRWWPTLPAARSS